MITKGSDIKLVFNISDAITSDRYDLEDATVLLKIAKPSKRVDDIYCKIIDIDNATVEANIAANILNESGVYDFNLIVTKKDGSVHKSNLNGFYVGDTINPKQRY
jgi:hypothetical protein